MDRDREEGAVTVLLAEERPSLDGGVESALRADARVRVVGRARDGRDAVGLGASLQPDVILLDVCSARVRGIEATGPIHGACPRTRVLALAHAGSGPAIRAAVAAGASGFVVTDGLPADVVRVIVRLAGPLRAGVGPGPLPTA